MVKSRQVQTRMRSSYYLEPGQTLKNSKISERKLMLVAPRREYNRFHGYVNESERMAVIVQKEKEKVAALRKATYEMSKNWDNTNENVKKRRDAELLAKRKQEDEVRQQFAKEIAQQNAEAQAQIVKEARRLLLYKKPLCRLLNGALLTSECFRERDAQLAFEKTLQCMEDEQKKEYAEALKKDVEASKEVEERKDLEVREKNRVYGVELKKQISEKQNDVKRTERDEYLLARQDLQNMERELKLMKESEEQEALNRRAELKKTLMDAIEEKRKFELESKREMEFCDRASEIFERSKRRIEKMRKTKTQEELDVKIRHADNIGRKFGAAAAKKKADDEETSMLKARQEIEAAELAKIEAKRQRALNLKMERMKLRDEVENEKRQRDYETKEINAWETLQRFKRDEFNKEFHDNQRKLAWERKMITAQELRQQMDENEKRRNLQKKLESEDNYTAAMIESTNKKVLEYGQQILDESRGVRPLFPILKTIEKYKMNNGLIPRKACDENNVLAPARKPRKRLPTCVAPIPEQQLVYI